MRPIAAKVLMDTKEHFPAPEVFAASIERHVDDAIARGFDRVEITYFHPRDGWQIMDIDLKRG